MKKIIAILFSTLFLANANDSSSEDGLTLSTEAIVSDYGDIRFENASEKQTEDKREILFEWYRSNWKTIVQQPEQFESTPSQAMLFRVLAEQLPPSDYLAYLSFYLDSVASGKRDGKKLGMVIGAPYQKMGFLVSEYENPEVQKIIQKALTVLPADSSSATWLKSLASSQVRQEYLGYIETSRNAKAGKLNKFLTPTTYSLVAVAIVVVGIFVLLMKHKRKRQSKARN